VQIGKSYPSPSLRLASLDTLRGAAILAVICSHILGAFSLTETLDNSFLYLGRGGVTLFFLLSGYLIFRNVQAQPITTFICRRFFKVMPAYWCNIIVILIADLSIDNFSHFSIRSYLASLLVVSDVLGIQAVSGVFWTLLIEIKFYVFIALQYAFFGRRHIHAILALLILLNLTFWAARGHGSLTLVYFPVFYLGIEIALAEEALWQRSTLARLIVVALVLAGNLYLCLDQQALAAAGYLLGCAIFFVVILRKNLSNRLAGLLGVTSYSNYLYHSIVVGSVFMIVSPHSGPTSIVAVVVAFIATTIIAAAFYGLVEVPMVRFGRLLSGRRAVFPK
jgi:peptidoglycan/LPS O-acetylase OafA/YrhL